MKEKKGEITVFLALTLTILVSVLFTVIEAARTNAARFQLECAADMALQSALAEYSRELLEQYELFFIETGYGAQEDSYRLLEEHIRAYLDENFHADAFLQTAGIRDLLSMSAESVTILEACGAIDRDGEALERAALDSITGFYGLSDLERLRDTSDEVEENDLLGDGMEERRRQNEKAIDAVDTTVEDGEDGKKEIPVLNPADAVNSRRGSRGLLTLVTRENGLSEKEVSLTEYLSHRGYTEKDGFLLGEHAVTGAEDLLFQKYLMEKCGCYTEQKENSALSYEMEYILTGKGSDEENLRSVTRKLLALRESANFLYLLSDRAKQGEAEALAMTLSAVILFPELKDLIKLSILIAWAFAESVYDIKILLEGGRIPLWKDRESWQLSLENAMKWKIEGGGAKDREGLDYKAYLHILLALTEKKERNLRFMDVVEMDIRRTPGNENFCIDRCVMDFTAELSAVGGAGNSCRITRTAGYQK